MGCMADVAMDVECLALSIHEHADMLSEVIAESVSCNGDVFTHTAYPV